MARELNFTTLGIIRSRRRKKVGGKNLKRERGG